MRVAPEFENARWQRKVSGGGVPRTVSNDRLLNGEQSLPDIRTAAGRILPMDPHYSCTLGTGILSSSKLTEREAFS